MQVWSNIANLSFYYKIYSSHKHEQNTLTYRAKSLITIRKSFITLVEGQQLLRVHRAAGEGGVAVRSLRLHCIQVGSEGKIKKKLLFIATNGPIL